jgi:membrane protein
MKLFAILRLFPDTAFRWMEDGAFRMSAALAYYAVFSMAPLLIILTFLIGLVYRGNTLVEVRYQLARFLDPDVADLVTGAAVQAGSRLTGGLAYSVLAFFLMFLGASAFSNELREAINTMWNIPQSPFGVWDMFRNRFGTLLIVFLTGVLLQISVLVSSIVSAYRPYLQSIFPYLDIFWRSVNVVLTFGVVVTLVALIYKWLPDARASWRDVWVGAVITTVLLAVGKSAIAFYLSRSSFQSIYGAAGSLMVLLAWLYYCSLIVLFGAEFTQVFAERYGRNIVPRTEPRIKAR